MEKILPKLNPAEGKNVLFRGVKNIYLVGIGGIGMSGLAFLLKERGFEVKGSDSKESTNVKMLRDQGIEVFIGHKQEQVSEDTDILSYSSAIEEGNPELALARKKGIKILRRSELLAALCQEKRTVIISGSHGKTTTTSLTGHVLGTLGYKPAVFVGGLPLNYSRGAWWGDDYFVIEADESDGGFLEFTPWISIITNIDCEHLDYYGSIDNLKKSFLRFTGNTSDKVIGWGDQPYLAELVAQSGGISFGWEKGNRLRGANFKFDGRFSHFDLQIDKKPFLSLKTPMVGRHNCLNTLAVLAFFHYLGEDLDKVARAILSFKGTRRRWEVKGVFKGVTFVDDYAHHPAEIKAVLSAARLLNPKRLFVVFQPHRFSRVYRLKEEFTRCFSQADHLVVSDIYSASEENTFGIDVQELTGKINGNMSGKAEYISKDELINSIPPRLKKGDLVLGLGAGDINKIMEDIRKCF